MAHFYPGTLVEISCYYIDPLSSSLLYSLILSFHSRHSFVQSAVFTTGDPVFFLFPFTLFPLFPPFPLLCLLIRFRVHR